MSEHDDKGYSEEKCLRCGWIMGSAPLNCNNDNTPHSFPSSVAALAQAESLAEQRGMIMSGRIMAESLMNMPSYQQGQRDTLAAIRAAVLALPYITDERWKEHAPITPVEYRKHVLAIINGEEKWGDQTSESRPRLPANGISATSVAPAGEDYGALMYAKGQRDALAGVTVERIEEVLMRDHKCLFYNGPGSGACKTCKRRAALVIAAIKGEPFEGHPPDSGTPMEWTEAPEGDSDE